MNLNNLGIARPQRVMDSHGCMRIRAGIQDQDAGRFRRLLYPIDEFALAIRLPERNLCLWRSSHHTLMNIIQRLMAINLWLARAEQVEVWAVEDINLLRHCHTLLRWNDKLGKGVHRIGDSEMRIFLNGEAKEIADGTSVLDLVLTLTGDPRGIAIERNLEIVPKAEHAATMLADGDRLEVVQFVGGG